MRDKDHSKSLASLFSTVSFSELTFSVGHWAWRSRFCSWCKFLWWWWMSWGVLHWKSALKKLLLLWSHPYFSCLGPGSLGGEWWFLSMLASHRRMEVLCATLGVGCGLGALRHQLRAVPWGSAAPPTWAQEMSQGCDLGELRRDLLVAQICWNCVCHLDCSVLKLLLRVSLVREVREVSREIFSVVTYWFLNDLSISGLSSRARDHPWTHQFALGFTMQRSCKYLGQYVVIQVWLKLSVHFRNVND